jgi:hypothetical protein
MFCQGSPRSAMDEPGQSSPVRLEVRRTRIVWGERTPRRVKRGPLMLVVTIATVLKHKGAEVWSVPPSASVYEAIETMASRGSELCW